MILIADSGSTKTEWRLINSQGEIQQALTGGLNPLHLDDASINRELAILVDHLNSLSVSPNDISQIYFYGAGCLPGLPTERMSQRMSAHFTKSEVEVKDDLLGAARGLCGTDPGIICILGTGANSGFYDGAQIDHKVRALGYILGDEGSGAWLGKTLLAGYMREELPPIISERLGKRTSTSPHEILDRIYRQPGAARYLAGYSKFIFQNIKDPYLYRLVHEGFSLFVEKNILKYPGHSNLPIHFCGSVAFYYSNILRQVAADRGITVRHVVEGPIAGLALYHKNLQKA